MLDTKLPSAADWALMTTFFFVVQKQFIAVSV